MLIVNHKVIAIIFGMSLLLSPIVLTQDVSAQQVPTWVKNTAKWFGDGLITEKEFLKAIEYLIENKFIIINPSDDRSQNETPKPSSYDSFEKIVEKGIEELKYGDHEDAIIYFDEALKRNPDNVRAMVDKGIAKASTGDLDGAKQLFDQAIKIGEKNKSVDYRAVVNAGIALSIYGNQTEAMSYFDRVIDNSNIVRQETLYAALVNKGIVLYEQEKYPEAISYYDQALEINPGKLGAIVNKANALQEMRDYDQALEWFEKAYKITKDPLAWRPSFIVITE
ncbi:MAG: tetratricopeptide repeat protein [Crenarchaeota archaeon]|nr:MAG: tetratricopeptide repeat protein [Thermoproteota archaeon]RDJ33056.1 MAG: tetratricopeptide repeat protein [Thermoproteota archaeon]RDJ36440.1 MAG: tetratricopeptide repeat protein [Thermoproteota archaeon]RDJ39068.1 MAG: tetratricopeptide repeat protein [Thermoproteota archaeon]